MVRKMTLNVLCGNCSTTCVGARPRWASRQGQSKRITSQATMKALTLKFRDFLGVEESMATIGKLEGDVDNEFVG